MVGLPVTTILFAFCNLVFASSNPNKTVFTFLASTFTESPGNALLSCRRVGIFNLFAALITGIQIYPPVPITTSALNSFIIFSESFIDLMVQYNLFIFFKVSFLSIPYASIVFNSYPALGTKSFSNPLSVPINRILDFPSISFILFAIAIPGLMCPPVPAAAIITFI